MQNAISEDLLKNGLELEAVSLTALDQTSFDALDENNAFNAVGMGKLAEVIAEAEGRHAIAMAENALSVEIVKRKIDLARLKAMPEFVAEMVKPAEKIDAIKIHQVTGLGGQTNGTTASSGTGGTPVNQALDSILGISMENCLTEVTNGALTDTISDATSSSNPTSRPVSDVSKPVDNDLPR